MGRKWMDVSQGAVGTPPNTFFFNCVFFFFFKKTFIWGVVPCSTWDISEGSGIELDPLH